MNQLPSGLLVEKIQGFLHASGYSMQYGRSHFVSDMPALASFIGGAVTPSLNDQR